MNKTLMRLTVALGTSTGWAQTTPPFDPGVVWATVSVRALTHKPPKAARKEFEKGMRALTKGQDAAAGPHFARAVALDSEYTGAHVMLGIQRAKAWQQELALQSFLRADELEPGVSDFQANTALLLIVMGRHDDAEKYARRAVRLLPSSAYAHFVLGFALVGQEQATPEAARSLRIAVERYPQATAVLRWVEERQVR